MGVDDQRDHEGLSPQRRKGRRGKDFFLLSGEQPESKKIGSFSQVVHNA
jgi:hypothetical protein